ncbi:MAG TPA: hypothetical protein VIY28_09080 [Pseudonocardiaceae bacterium]
MASAVAGFAVLGTLGACAYGPDQAGFEGHPHPAPVAGTVAPIAGPDWPTPPAGAPALPSDQIDASALPSGYPRLVWTQGDGRALGLYGQEGGCTYVHSDLREQTPRLVRIALVEVTTRSGPCTKELRFLALATQLDAPLGGRTVVLERQTVGPPPGR